MLGLPDIQTVENFPGNVNARPFLEAIIRARKINRVADLGGGANPMLASDFVARENIDYTVFDIDQRELDKAPTAYHKICVDISAPKSAFMAAVGEKTYDMVFSHMFIEHLQDAEASHKNIFAMLAPGGLAIHMYPLPYMIPLAINRLLPEWLTRMMVRVAQPNRALDGNAGKFPAYYRMCLNPSATTRRRFEALGYMVREHVAYIGHSYYDRLAPLAWLEEKMRAVLVKLRIPMTSVAVIILERQS